MAFAAYVVAFLAQARGIVRVLYLNADIASGPVMAHLLPAAPSDREVLLGNYLWAEALALQRLLDALPADRVLLEAVPFGLGLLTAGLTAYAVLIVARDRWTAAMAAIVVLAAGATVWACLGTWTVHGLTWLHVAILGAFVAWLEQRPRTVTAAAAVAVLVGVVTGVGAASHPSDPARLPRRQRRARPAGPRRRRQRTVRRFGPRGSQPSPTPRSLRWARRPPWRVPGGPAFACAAAT